MKTLIRLGFLAAVISAGHLNLSAQVYPISAQLVVQQQDQSTLVNGVYTDKIRTTRLTSNYLLTLLQPFYTSTLPNGFPLGSRLTLVNFSHFQVESPGGTVLVTNTAPFLTYSDTFSQTNYLFRGKESLNTGALNHTYSYHATIAFQDPSPQGTAFTFTGNVTERYIRSAADFYGDHLSQGSLMITGFGSGSINGSFFLMSGKFSSPTIRWIE